MKPLLVLVIVFVLFLLSTKFIGGNFEFALSARVAMSVMLLFTALGHFMYTKGMSMMLPNFIPYKNAVVYITGVIEIAAAIGLLIPGVRVLTGWLLIAFFIIILPANIYAAIRHIDYQKGSFNGNGVSYLWFRVPLQIFFIIWVYFSVIKNAQ